MPNRILKSICATKDGYNENVSNDIDKIQSIKITTQNRKEKFIHEFFCSYSVQYLYTHTKIGKNWTVAI